MNKHSIIIGSIITLYSLVIAFGCVWIGTITLLLTAYDYAWLYSLATILFGFNNFFLVIIAWTKAFKYLKAWSITTSLVFYALTLEAYISGVFLVEELKGALSIGVLLIINYLGILYIYTHQIPNKSLNQIGANNAPPG